MQRAVRAVSNRLVVVAAAARSEGALDAPDGSAAAVRTEDVHEALRTTAPAPWMAPPCQRGSQTLGAFSKFTV